MPTSARAYLLPKYLRMWASALLSIDSGSRCVLQSDWHDWQHAGGTPALRRLIVAVGEIVSMEIVADDVWRRISFRISELSIRLLTSAATACGHTPVLPLPVRCGILAA